MPCVAALRRRMNAHMVSTCVRRRPHEQVVIHLIDDLDWWFV